MTPEQQPPDQGNYLTISKRELLRRSVINLATTAVNDETSDVLRRGGKRQKNTGARFLVAQITSPGRLYLEDTAEPYLDHALELYAYDSYGNRLQEGERRPFREPNLVARGSFEVLSLSVAGITAIIEGQRYSNLSPTYEDEFISEFYKRNRINGRLLASLARPPRVTTV